MLVHEPEMMVVEKILRYAAEGVPVRAIQVRLQAEGTLAPRGGEVWDDHVPYSGGKNLSIVGQGHLQPERLDVLEIELICRLL